MAVRKEGRGRLSKIDQLPPEADPHIQWAASELIARDRTQADILFELNDRLEAIGCDPISSSAFQRHSTRLAAITRRLNETREIAAAVSKEIGADRADDVTVMLVQLIKQASIELLERGTLGSKAIKELGQGLQSAVNAQVASAKNREAEALRTKRQIEKAASAAAANMKGFSPETVDAIKAEILGLTLPEKDGAAANG